MNRARKRRQKRHDIGPWEREVRTMLFAMIFEMHGPFVFPYFGA